jgi:hypothetical protein
MALVTANLAKDLKDIFDEMDASNEPKGNRWLAEKMAAAIDKQTKTAEVQPGITVKTTGTATAQTGATDGTGELK